MSTTKTKWHERVPSGVWWLGALAVFGIEGLGLFVAVFLLRIA